jgi:hypothetical protein
MGPSPNSELRHQNQLTVKNNALALIVENDPAIRALEEIVLEANRFPVRTAKNREEPSGWRANAVRRSSCWTSPGRLRLASMFLKTFKDSADTAQIPVVLTPTSWKTLAHARAVPAHRWSNMLMTMSCDVGRATGS